MYISNPTWGNHRNIFGDEGVEWKYYRYFDQETIGLDFKGMCEDLRAAPEGSVVVLHGECRVRIWRRVGAELEGHLAMGKLS